jgi:hypothetical protein
MLTQEFVLLAVVILQNFSLKDKMHSGRNEQPLDCCQAQGKAELLRVQSSAASSFPTSPYQLACIFEATKQSATFGHLKNYVGHTGQQQEGHRGSQGSKLSTKAMGRMAASTQFIGMNSARPGRVGCLGHFEPASQSRRADHVAVGQ